MNWIGQVLGAINPSLGNLHGFTLAVFLTVFVLSALFILGYVIQGIKVWKQLNGAINGLKRIKASGQPVSKDEAGSVFLGDPIKHLWEEYSDTLHELKKASSGGVELRELRATVPAETMFTREVLVDGRLLDEFTRHLPGVLTGLGIIGTFAGLLEGLGSFNPATAATAVSGLGPLMEGVKHAFVASGVAIGCAMAVVFISRLTLAYFYSMVETLTQIIDSLYATGAGEEYLSRLVKASERNEANTSQLKDALVEDLNKMMTNLVDRQIAAHEAATVALGDRIGQGIATGIAEPMKKFGDAMEANAKGNGQQVEGMLETLLTGFMAKLEDTFGGQMRGINEQMQRSMDVMTSVQTSLQSLLTDIKATNEHASNQFSGKLEDAMKQAAENQQLLTDQMRQFVQDFRKLITEEQNKSKQTMDDAIMKVLGDVSLGMQNLEKLRKDAAAEESGRNEKLSDETGKLVGGLTTQVDNLLTSISEQVNKTQQNIDAFSQVSTRAIDGMNQGALTMGAAAKRFETAGNSVTEVFKASTGVADKLNTSANSLQAAASAVQKGFDQYDSTRRTVDQQVAALMGLIESAKKEAGVSTELIANIRASADSLLKAEAESRQHLDSVNEALAVAFKRFGDELVQVLKKTITETDRHLSAGTGHLNGVVQEFASAVHRMKKV
ncbi:anti-phage ZorAB system protein ZorA [Limnohabitans sp. Bal53]|uniref:anti-phage ZorAB system protein ZorA n=1 Tax=Limnohabitans sp. Bal53 TaxID=1977910 RepID=UPI000D3322D0|nr:anti-phage ZorAB system protein ZorA [Limnohabitans sp. Bal53]PUE40273.1 chemotaxis protein [Limnohabitans sp. Bal53]